MVEAQRLVFSRRRKLGYNYDFCFRVVWEMERLVIVGCGSSTILKAEDTGPLEVTSRLGAGRFGEVFAAPFALKAVLKQPMVDFEPGSQSAQAIARRGENCATSRSSGIQWRKSLCCWSISWAETCKPGVWRAGFRAPCVGADVWATPYSCPETSSTWTLHYAWEPLPHRHWQAKDWWFWLLLKGGWTATPSRKCTLPPSRSRDGVLLCFHSFRSGTFHCHWPWRTCAPSLLHVKELRWRSDCGEQELWQLVRQLPTR